MAKSTKIRKGMPSVQLSKAEFSDRLRERVYDPAFAEVAQEIERIIEKAWEGYDKYRKNPRTQSAGRGSADPDFKLPVEWLETRTAILSAERRQENRKAPSRILLINGSSRSDQSCPGEMSKTFRLVTRAKEVIAKARGFEIDLLDLSRSLQSTDALFTRARHASLRRCHCATGLAPVIRTTPCARWVTGWRKSIRAGRLPTGS